MKNRDSPKQKQLYQVTFLSELSEDDLKAMNGCFYDAMNEAMLICPFNLKLEKINSKVEKK